MKPKEQLGLQRHGDFRRVYGHQQAFVFGFAVGIMLSGLSLLLFTPVGGVEDQLDPAFRVLYRLSYLIGGAMLTLGIWFPSARLEAGGHVIVASLFVSALSLTLAMSPPFEQVVTSIAFIAPLAVGSALRAYFLVTDSHG
jgi:hypothetical protein